ncbi:hypothetical protein D0T90_10130 [Neisseria animalis]|uniref:Uncharacterized protein n=2 Tax=Neisseria animalis TaxID=492 RepID=A0A5P3MVU6_NEIAN|nr:hypothetical protein D0T90_10130 [Neisseria animalis]
MIRLLNRRFDMSDKLKEWLCEEDKPLGRFTHWLARLGVSSKVVIDVRDFDEFETYCWCCCVWRGLIAGGLIGLLAGWLACKFLL